MEVTGGGYPGFKDKHKKYSAKPSLSSASNASTGSTKRLIWQFLKAIDLCQGKFRYEVEIEKTMKMQMAMAGNVKMSTSPEGNSIQGKQILAGWKLRRVCL